MEMKNTTKMLISRIMLVKTMMMATTKTKRMIKTMMMKTTKTKEMIKTMMMKTTVMT